MDLNYLVLLYVPLLAYQFSSFNIERNLKWKANASEFIAVGCTLVMFVELAQLLRGLVGVWPSNVVMYHALMVALLLIVVASVAIRSRLPKLLAAPNFLLVVIAVGVIVFNVILPVQRNLELNVTLVSQVALCALCLIPFIGREKQPGNYQQRPNPNDFRPL